ncbi:MAG: 5'-nucleotidase, lipoprotein e(P4) family, partial [Rhodopirellula sp. JB053]
TTAINVPTWSADLVQQAELAGHEPAKTDLPTAVILDIDETVLDNSPYQSRRINEDGGFTPESWEDWVREARAEPVPGVREFLRSAVDAGVVVFFVTNRENSVEHATRRNLEQLGLVESDAIDRILSKRERDEWTSDKATRRAHIAKRYRILLLIGDDLNDFISVGEEPTSHARRDLAAEHGDMWGVKWIQLPNPNYGGWERSIYDWEDAADDAVKLQRKYDSLQK